MKLTDALSERWILLGLIFYVFGLAAWLLVNGVRVTLEDGFYYFKIAQNIAQGAGSTFDGVNLTNGYHPLWLLILTPIFWMTSSTTTALTLGIGLQASLFAATASLVYLTARLSLKRFGAVLAALLWVLFTFETAFGGLEFSLQAFGILLVVYFYLRWFAQATPQPLYLYLGLGIVLSLTFLARLDTIGLAVLIGGVLAWREVRQGLSVAGLQRIAAVGIPLGLTCLGYFGINLSLFGHPFPVSGMAKRSWSIYLLSQDPLYLQYGWVGAKIYHLLWPVRQANRLFPFSLLMGTVGAGIWWLIQAIRSDRQERLHPYSPFISFSLISYVSYFLIYHDNLSYPSWYYVVQPWLTAMLLAALADKIKMFAASHRGPGQKALYQAIFVGFSVGWLGVAGYTLWRLDQWRVADQTGAIPQPMYQAAAWVQVNLANDVVIGAWNAGALGYLSGRRVVNLDGLVNSWNYYERDKGDLCRYWQKHNITYIVDIFDYRTDLREAIAPEPTYPQYARCAAQLDLIWSAQPDAKQWWRLEAYRISGGEEEGLNER